MQNEKDNTFKRIRSDHGGEFENHKFSNWCNEMGIKHEFLAPKTPQQNGVVERKNRALQEMANVMPTSKNMAKKFWAEVVNTTCYIINQVYLRPRTTKTAYEIWNDRKPNINYFRVFGSPCYILRDTENIGKFDSKSDEATFLGYSLRSRAYRVYNK